MGTEKKKKKVKKIIAYLLDTNDKDIINHYADMIMNVFKKND